MSTSWTGRIPATRAGLTIGSYRTTLNERETTEDHDEKGKLLSACHQRCAERTLSVLEKNGGIFIKLGQHLACLESSLVVADVTNNILECHELPSTARMDDDVYPATRQMPRILVRIGRGHVSQRHWGGYRDLLF